MRPPTPRQIPTVVLVRRETTGATSAGPSLTYSNTLYRASVALSGASARPDHGQQGSIRSGRLVFGFDPGVKAGDKILVPPALASDPGSPATGALWVNTTAGAVKQWDGTAAQTVAGYADLYGTPVEVDGATADSFGGRDVLGEILVAEGPAENSNQIGIQWRVEVTGRG
jgi:hypothetical protein